jgi:aminopeptidase N
VSGREAAIGLDSVATTHPVIQRVATVEQISQAFDAITYQKGEAVITMLEDYVGEDAWRRGVRDYMATYRLNNTVTDNLWQKVEAAAGKPITAIAHDFTLQPGVPLIRVEDAACSGWNDDIEAEPRRVHARQAEQAAPLLARPGDRDRDRRQGGADDRHRRLRHIGGPGLRHRRRQQRPDRLLPDPVRAGPA